MPETETAELTTVHQLIRPFDMKLQSRASIELFLCSTRIHVGAVGKVDRTYMHLRYERNGDAKCEQSKP